jgi:hypothetical protein
MRSDISFLARTTVVTTKDVLYEQKYFLGLDPILNQLLQNGFGKFRRIAIPPRRAVEDRDAHRC